MHVNQWVQKQQKRHGQLEALKQLAATIQRTLIQKTVMQGFIGVATYSNKLWHKERQVAQRVQRRIRSKTFFRWFDGYFTQLEGTYLNYTRALKAKVIRALHFERRKTHLKTSKAILKFGQNVMFKVWLGLLRNLNEVREEKHHLAMVRRSAREKTYVEKGVVVQPVLDKILPDERIDFYSMGTEENQIQTQTLQNSVDGNNVPPANQGFLEQQNQRAGAPYAFAHQTASRASEYGPQSSMGNPFKTLDARLNT